jgi:hypothetical protein
MMKSYKLLFSHKSIERGKEMGIDYENLDERTREFMIKELDLDVSNKKLYVSPRLNSVGKTIWENVLREAIQNHNDDWLAEQLLNKGCMKTHEERRTRSGGMTMAKVPVTARETLAEGEFNRFYARGLCARALEDGIPEVEVYRGKQVKNPRPTSQAMIGKKIDAKTLLEDLRTSQGVEPALKLPPGPNSGLTIRLPN